MLGVYDLPSVELLNLCALLAHLTLELSQAAAQERSLDAILTKLQRKGIGGLGFVEPACPQQEIGASSMKQVILVQLACVLYPAEQAHPLIDSLGHRNRHCPVQFHHCGRPHV